MLAPLMTWHSDFAESVNSNGKIASYIERLILADADKASTAKKQYLFVLRQKNDAVRHSDG